MATDTRDRIIEASSELFRRRGYTGTGLKQVSGQAGAPSASIYHFFPGGKQELGETVIRTSGPLYAVLVYSILDPYDDLLVGLEAMFAEAASMLEATDYADACPIATIALEVASTNETLRIATADVFEGWIQVGTDRLVARGLPEAEARYLTFGLINALEGAFVLGRSMRSTEPLVAAGRMVLAATREALAGRS